MPSSLEAYSAFEFRHGPWTRRVYRRGAGPAVIIIHGIPGLHPLAVRFADRVAEAGMSVFLPSVFGEPGRPISRLYQSKAPQR
jgi:dienelactone hydrolase